MKKHLKSLGFKKKWLDDKSGYWWEKKCLNPWLPKCKVTVEELIGDTHGIFVSCQDPDDKDGTRDLTVDIHQSPYSKRQLQHVLDYFDIGWEVDGIGADDVDNSVKIHKCECHEKK